MANATGKGKLIVGIYEDPTTKLGEIRGFPLRYVNNKEKVKPKTEEEMKKILRQDYLSKFRPMFTLDELQFEFFEVYGQWNEQRLVLIFHLNLKFAVNCTYDGKKWIRVDTENLDPSKFIAA